MPQEAGGPANMPQTRGGYQAPANPAPVSGPGAMSARTDSQPQQAMQRLANAKYGEQKAFQQQQASAPMASAPVPSAPSPSAMQGGGKPNVIGFGEKTQRPNEPVTAGANAGPGPGMEVLNLPPSTNKQDFTALRPALPILQMLANLPGASPGAQQFVRYLQGGGMPSAPQGGVPNVPTQGSRPPIG